MYLSTQMVAIDLHSVVFYSQRLGLFGKDLNMAAVRAPRVSVPPHGSRPRAFRGGARAARVHSRAHFQPLFVLPAPPLSQRRGEGAPESRVDAGSEQGVGSA